MMKCHKLKIPERVCYVWFKKEKIDHSADIGYTNRKEMFILDYNKKGEIIGIELVGNKKPCQN